MLQGYFRVHWNRYGALELKIIREGNYQLPAYEKFQPLWLPDEEKLSVEIVYNS